MILHYISDHQRDWDRYTFKVGFAYNQTVHSSTRYTPNKLTFRFNVPHFSETIPLPSSVEVDISKMEMQRIVNDNADAVYRNMRISQERNKRSYDRTGQPATFTVGQDVYLDRQVPTPGLSRKLLQPSLEKYKVIRVHLQGHLYDLGSHRTGKVDVFHADRLRQHPHQDNVDFILFEEENLTEDALPLPDHLLEGEDGYEADRLLRHCFAQDGSREFLIKWSGYSHKYDTWEPENNISPALVRKYDQRKQA